MKKVVLVLLIFTTQMHSQSSGLTKDETLSYIKELDAAIAVNPTAFDYYLRGVQKYNLNEFNDAIEDFDMSIDIDDSKKESYFYRGMCEESLKHFKKALDDYNQSLALNSKYEDAISRKAYCKTILLDFEGAIKDYTFLIELNPTSLSHNNRGLAYYNINQSTQAIPDFNRAIELDSNNIEALQNRALAKAMINDKTAINDFNKVIELQPKNAKAYYNRAIHLINFKLKGDYCSDLKKSLSLGFTEAEKIIIEVCK